jgi:phosphatidylserine/phosphatidylglycerophosphate/cardiolipin synthase-like enzyme
MLDDVPHYTRRPREIVVPIALKHTQQATCTAPWFVQMSEYHPLPAGYKPLINGEEAFSAVHQAIAAAEKTVDIICWGFQPSMYFIRDGSAPSIGELLMSKARQGVQVRILGWEMPLNSAGVAGEANLPGKGPLSIQHQAGQTASEQQHAYDHYWYKACAVSDDQAAARVGGRTPVFVSRGFSHAERKRIEEDVTFRSLDRELSEGMITTLKLTVSHHQKCVLVDYEIPEHAVGFVMGHNMLDEYWDTDTHSALRRPNPKHPGAEQYAPNRGPRGAQPRQDISSRVSGPILEHLHHNFAQAWRKETGEDLFQARQSRTVAERLSMDNIVAGDNLLMAQLLRTQPQEGVHDIQTAYLDTVRNATQFIYIENQYFRWPPLAAAIKQAAVEQTAAGRDPGQHGALHLFVITNATDEGMGKGTVNTQRMLESLGRADTIPEVTKARRIEQVKKDMPPRPRPDGPSDRAGERQLYEWKQELYGRIKAIDDSLIEAEERPGLKVHICSLVAPDSPAGKPWVPVYIHSKLMIINDVYTTHGSANINTRSMQVDSELNIAHEWHSVTQAMRRRLWNLHTKEMGAQDDPKQAFRAWGEIISKNVELQKDKEMGTPWAPIIEFRYAKATLWNID